VYNDAGTHIATVCSAFTIRIWDAANKTVRVWDVATGQKLLWLATPASNDIAISPDGQQYAVGGTNGTIVLWNAQAHQVKPVRSLTK
jgi:WD40 repeat protein